MSPVLPALAAVALSGLHDIKGTIPPPGLPPLAFSALAALTALGAGAFSAARKRWGRQHLSVPDDATAVQRLLKLRDAYRGGTIPQPLLFDQLWEELTSSGLAGAGSIAPDHSIQGVGAAVPEDTLALLRSLVTTCDAVRYGRETLERDRVLNTLDAAVAAATTWRGRRL